MKPKHLYLLFACTLLLATILWIIWGNTALEVSTYQIPHALLPEAFDGYRIAHISDLHNTQIGKNNKRLLSMLRESLLRTQPQQHQPHFQRCGHDVSCQTVA